VSHTLAEGEVIWGIALFKHQLYIGRHTIIEVYHSSTLLFQRNLPVAGLGSVNDMTSCPDCHFLFLVDDRNKLIHVVGESGLTANWKVDDVPFKLSVNLQLNVLVTFSDTRKLRSHRVVNLSVK